jgi:hypothetical protein
MVIYFITVCTHSVNTILQDPVWACCISIGLEADHNLDTLFLLVFAYVCDVLISDASVFNKLHYICGKLII